MAQADVCATVAGAFRRPRFVGQNGAHAGVVSRRNSQHARSLRYEGFNAGDNRESGGSRSVPRSKMAQKASKTCHFVPLLAAFVVERQFPGKSGPNLMKSLFRRQR